jgi:DNA-binding response OmpR family regulator
MRIKVKIDRYRPNNIVEIKSYKIDFDNNIVTNEDNSFELSPKEAKLLALFVNNNNRVITKEMIIDSLWSSESGYSEGSIRVYINNLKNIFGKDSIKNLRGVGYRAMWNR